MLVFNLLPLRKARFWWCKKYKHTISPKPALKEAGFFMALQNERFDPAKHQESIRNIVDSSLEAYRLVLMRAGVPEIDIIRMCETVEQRSTKGLRKAEWFAALIESVCHSSDESLG